MKDKEVRKVPKLRFPGFTDDWEQRKLGELAVFNPKEEIPDVFEYVDLESVVGTQMLSHRTEEKAIAPSRAQRLAHTGDLFYQTVRPYQKNNYLFEKTDKHYVFSTGYAQLRPFIDGYFLLSLVQNGQFVKTVLDNCTGTSYPAINANDLAEIEVFSPKDEQEHHQIGTYFRNLDNLITLHQRKLENLKNLKKGLLQKMFPKNGEKVPELRFPGFTDDWEQRKLDECFYERTEKQSTGELLSVTIENGVRKFSELLKKDNSSEDKSNYKKVCKGDIAYNSMRMWQGACGKSDYDGLVSPAYTVLVAKINVDSNYMAYMFKTYDMLVKFQRFSQGMTSDTWNLKFNALKKIELYIGSYKEQKEICNIMVMLDNLITLHQRKLEHLQMQKKGLLQQMFV